jgi:hypothetical protein
MNVGDCFWLATQPTYTRHLWIIIAEMEGELLTVNISTSRPSCDRSCVLQPGDHPEITRESVVRYDFARTWRAEDLRKCVETRRLPLAARFDSRGLSKIIQGARQSKHLPKKYKKWF